MYLKEVLELMLINAETVLNKGAKAIVIACNTATAVVLEEMMKRGKTPRLLKSANFPGGVDYNNAEVYPHYKEFGW